MKRAIICLVMIGCTQASSTHKLGDYTPGRLLPTNPDAGAVATQDDAGHWVSIYGSNGQVLTSQGPGAPALFADAGSGGTTLPDAGNYGIWYQNDAGAVLGLAAGAVGQALITQGTGAPPFWNNINAGFFGPVTIPPLAGTFTQYNAGGRSTSLSTVNNTLLFSCTNGTTGYDARLGIQAIPGSTWTVIAHFAVVMEPVTNILAGIGCRQSSNGSIEMYEIQIDATTDLITKHQAIANNTTTSPTYTQSSVSNAGNARSEYVGAGGYWMKLQDDGTNRLMSMSQNGADWSQLFSTGRTSFLTCDQWGIEIFSSNAAPGTISARFDSLVATSP